jgi:hypothetical protein
LEKNKEREILHKVGVTMYRVNGIHTATRVVIPAVLPIRVEKSDLFKKIKLLLFIARLEERGEVFFFPYV